MDENGFMAVIASKFSWATCVAFIGVIVKHYVGFKSKQHAFWSVDLIFGIIVAMLMGLIGSGFAEYFALGPNATTGLIATMGYVGPKGLSRLWEIVIERLEQNGKF